MRSLNIDLAAKFSAASVMDGPALLHQFDSWGKTPNQFVSEIVSIAKKYKVEVIAVEDVPYGLSKQFMIKPALRLQGRLIQELENAGLAANTLFINPATWQRTFEGVYGGKEKGALAAAGAFGYQPPDMLAIHEDEIPAKGPERAKVRAQLKKASTDYVDAYLIGVFVSSFENIEAMLNNEKKGIQRP